MSNPYSEAAEWFDREAARGAGLLRAAEALRQVGSLQQAADEAQVRIDSARIEWARAEDAWKVTLARAAGDLQEIERQIVAARAVLTGIQVETREELQAATDRAGGILEVAQDRAATIVRQAEVEATAQRSKLMDEAADLVVQIARSKAMFTTTTTAVAESQAKLDRLNAEIDALKAKF